MSTNCDSLVTTQVTIGSEIVVNQPTVEDCDSVFFSGVWYTTSTSVSDTTLLVSGCDSINITPIVVNLTQSVNGPDATGMRFNTSEW